MPTTRYSVTYLNPVFDPSDHSDSSFTDIELLMDNTSSAAARRPSDNQIYQCQISTTPYSVTSAARRPSDNEIYQCQVSTMPYSVTSAARRPSDNQIYHRQISTTSYSVTSAARRPSDNQIDHRQISTTPYSVTYAARRPSDNQIYQCQISTSPYSVTSGARRPSDNQIYHRQISTTPYSVTSAARRPSDNQIYQWQISTTPYSVTSTARRPSDNQIYHRQISTTPYSVTSAARRPTRRRSDKQIYHVRYRPPYSVTSAARRPTDNQIYHRQISTTPYSVTSAARRPGDTDLPPSDIDHTTALSLIFNSLCTTRVKQPQLDDPYRLELRTVHMSGVVCNRPKEVMCSVVPNNDLPSVQPIRKINISDVKQYIDQTYKNYGTLYYITANILLIILVTLLITKLFASDCKNDDDGSDVVKGVKVHCVPYTPLERIVVDIDLNTTSHCYSSKSCVILAESLHRLQGKFRYNFIIGAFGFVYIEHGFRCQSEEWGDALYIRLPVDSIYSGQDFMATQRATSKFYELLREGLECGKILHNFTVTTTGCGKFNDWCTQALQDIVTGESSDRGIAEHRLDYFDNTQKASLFNPFNLKRVYNYKYKLIVCKQNKGHT
ncbi:hypothetical protein J6590_061987 [Homalodisca vitripennis]|nr:hypothetical protein J6590_061987 [Homalodisca vitripennis]